MEAPMCLREGGVNLMNPMILYRKAGRCAWEYVTEPMIRRLGDGSEIAQGFGLLGVIWRHAQAQCHSLPHHPSPKGDAGDYARDDKGGSRDPPDGTPPRN